MADRPDDERDDERDDESGSVWGPEFDAQVAAHDNLSPHPVRAKLEKMMSGMDEIRAMYPTPEARAEAGIDEEGWLGMERAEAKIREAYPAFVAEDDRVIELHKKAKASREEKEAALARVHEAFANLGLGFN